MRPDEWWAKDSFVYAPGPTGLSFFRCRACGHLVPAVRERGHGGRRQRRLLEHAVSHMDGVELRLAV